jgi:hypothetical protein
MFDSLYDNANICLILYHNAVVFVHLCLHIFLVFRLL